MHSLNSFKVFLKELNEENIKFKQHFYERTIDRPISEGLVRNQLRKTETLLKIELQPSLNLEEEKYKLWFKLSNKYLLVVISVISKKDLYIVTSWNTNRKWKKIIQE